MILKWVCVLYLYIGLCIILCFKIFGKKFGFGEERVELRMIIVVLI